jgi:hypothetical protein
MLRKEYRDRAVARAELEAWLYGMRLRLGRL